jgi:hypothetical protein
MSNFTKKQIKVDSNLSKILNVPIESYVSFADITKKVYEYIKVNNLRILSTKIDSSHEKPSVTPRFCFTCGFGLERNAKFCNKCGKLQ